MNLSLEAMLSLKNREQPLITRLARCYFQASGARVGERVFCKSAKHGVMCLSICQQSFTRWTRLPVSIYACQSSRSFNCFSHARSSPLLSLLPSSLRKLSRFALSNTPSSNRLENFDRPASINLSPTLFLKDTHTASCSGVYGIRDHQRRI